MSAFDNARKISTPVILKNKDIYTPTAMARARTWLALIFAFSSWVLAFCFLGGSVFELNGEREPTEAEQNAESSQTREEETGEKRHQEKRRNGGRCPDGDRKRV